MATRPWLTPEEEAALYGTPPWTGLLGQAAAPLPYDPYYSSELPPEDQYYSDGPEYNIEDLIRELGLTPEEAEEVLKAEGRASPLPPLSLEGAELPLVKPVEADQEEEEKPLVRPKAEEEEKPFVLPMLSEDAEGAPSAAQMAAADAEQNRALVKELEADAAVEEQRIDAITPLRRQYETIVAGFIANNPKASAKEVIDFANKLSTEQYGGEFKGFTQESVEAVLAAVAKDPRAAKMISFTGDVLSPEEIERASRDIARATDEDGRINVAKLQTPYEGDPIGAMGQTLRGTATQVVGGLMQAALGEDLPLGLDKVHEDLRLKGQELGAEGRLAQEMADPGYAPQTPEWYAFNAVKSAAEIGVAIAGSAGNPTLGAMVIGARVFGQTYDDAIAEGRTPGEAAHAAWFSAVAEFVPERLALAQILSPTGKVVTDFAKGALAEGAQEVVTEALQLGYDLGVLDENVTVKDALQRLADAGILGGMAGGTIAATVSTGANAADSQWAQAVAQRWQERLATREMEQAEFGSSASATAMERFAPRGEDTVVPFVRPVSREERVAPATPAPVSEEGAVETFLIPKGQVTSRFGPRQSFTTANGKKASSNHAGVDIAMPAGAPVPAGASGIVTVAETRGGYGKQVVVKHSDGTTSSYSHLSAIDVEVGDRINQGEVVGKVGATGNATGPHLHLERRDAQGRPVNPLTARPVKTTKRGNTYEDDTPWDVSEEAYTNENADPWPQREVDETFEAVTGVELAETAEPVGSPRPAPEVAPQREEPSALAAVTRALSERSPADDVADRVRDRLDSAQQHNIAAQALPNVATDTPQLAGMQSEWEPVVDSETREEIGVRNVETGEIRLNEDIPEGGGQPTQQDFVSMVSPETLATTPEIPEGSPAPEIITEEPATSAGELITEPPSETEAVEEAVVDEAAVDAVAQQAAEEILATLPKSNGAVLGPAREAGQRAVLGLETEPFVPLSKAQQNAYELGVKDAESALQRVEIPQATPTTPAPQAVPVAAPAATAEIDAIDDKADSYGEKLFDLEVGGTKADVKRFAQRLVREGVIDKAEFDGLAYMFKDRDMSVEDITSELSTSIQIWAKRQKEALNEQPPALGGQRTEESGLPQRRGVSRSPRPMVGDGRQDTLFGPPLEGAPGPVDVPGVGKVQFGQHPPAVAAAESYSRIFAPIFTKGFEYLPPRRYAKLDKARATKIALAYEAMKHDPNDPEVKAAYKALTDETLAQFEIIQRTGLKVEFIDIAQGDPYAASPRLLQLDVAQNNHLWVFKTDDGFGDSPITEADIAENPMLADSGIEIDGHRLRVNDVFRIVHDYFGHVKDGHGFRAEGEENAWQSHAAMYSPLARRAMTTETRGQNSWVNFGPHGDANRKASSAETRYAPQKTGLLPLWASEEGYIGGQKNEPAERYRPSDRVSAANDTRGDEGAVLTRPPTDENGNVVLEHFSLEESLDATDPSKWGRSSKWLPEEERRRMGVAPARTYFGIAIGQPGGYTNEFRDNKHPRFGTPVFRYKTEVKLEELYDMAGDPDGLKEIGRALPKHPNGRYIYGDFNLSPSIPGIDGVSLYEQLIKDAGYKGYWIKSGIGLVAAVFESVPVTPVTSRPQQTSAEIGAKRESERRQARAYKDSLLKQVHAILGEMGAGGLIPVHIVDAIHAEGYDSSKIRGSYDPADGIMRIAAWADNVRGIARHEIVHWAVHNGVWDAAEWRLLTKWAKSNPGIMAWAKEHYGHEGPNIVLEEAVAEGFSRWRGGKLGETDSAVAKLFQRLLDILTIIRRAFTQSGITRAEMRKAEQLLAEFENGKRLAKWRAAQDKRPSFGRKQWNYDLSRELMSGNIDPAQHWFLSQQPGVRFQTAWHGSPKEDIDKFSLDFIGQGEGAQAFGWGLYFAEKKAVAEWYQRKLTMGHKDPVDVIVQVDGQPIREWIKQATGGSNPYVMTAQYEVADRIFSYLTSNKPYNGWLDALHARFDNEADQMIMDAAKEGNAQEVDELAILQREVGNIFEAIRDRIIDQKTYPVGGKLYKVEVPEADDLIDLDKKVKDQPPKVKAALMKLRDELDRAGHLGADEINYGEFREWDAMLLVRHILPKTLYWASPTDFTISTPELESAMDAGHGAMATSILLRNVGIRGSRYLDRDSRVYAEGEPLTHNFVIFDDNAIQLKARYQVASAGMGGSVLSDPTRPNPGIFRRIHDQTMALLTAIAGKDLDTTDNLADAFRRKVTQRYRQIVKTQERAATALGVDRLAPGQNPMEMITADERGYKLGFLNDNMMKPMFALMAQRDIQMEDLGLYLYARHAPARNARVAKINKEFNLTDKPGSGMTNDEAAEIMRKFSDEGRLSDLQDVAVFIDQMIDYAQQQRLAAGLISSADVASGFQPGDYYVPLRGNSELEPEVEMDFALTPKKGGGFSISGKESHRMYGRASKADLVEIVGYTITQAQEAIDRGYRNQIGQNILGMLRAVPDSKFAQIDRVKRVAVLDRKTGKVHYEEQTRITDPKEQQRTIYVKENGSVTKITFNDKNPSAMRFVKAAKNLGIEPLSRWLHLLSLYTRFWSKSNTQWNVDFILANAVKDVQTGVLNASTLNQKGLRRAMLKNLASMKPLLAAWWGATHPAGHGYGKGKKWDTYYAEFAEQGGKINYNEVTPLEDALRLGRREIRNAQRSAIHPLKAGAKVVEWIDRSNSAFENMTRLAAYGALRDMGVPAKQAAVAVKELTTNFEQHGEWGPKVNAAYGFANASIIGGSRFIFTLYRKPQILGGIVILGMLEDLINSAWDDEWDEYKEEDKNANFMILLPEAASFDIKLPIGYGINAFVTAGRKMSELWRGKKKEDGTRLSLADAVGDFGWSLYGAFAPVSGHSFWNVLSPTAFDPIVDIYQNQNNWGRPIMPPQSFRKEQQEPDSQLAFRKTGQFWKSLAESVNALGGGNDVLPGWTWLNEAGDISPESYKHVVSQTVGGMGRSILRAFNLTVSVAKGEDIAPNDIPVIRRFAATPFGAATREDEQISAFYERFNGGRLVAEQAKDLIARYGKDSETYIEFRDENEKVLRFNRSIKSAGKVLTQINAANKALDRGVENENGLGRDEQGRRDQRAIYNATGVMVPLGRRLPEDKVEKVREKLYEKRTRMATAFNSAWLRNVMEDEKEGQPN